MRPFERGKHAGKEKSVVVVGCECRRHLQLRRRDCQCRDARSGSSAFDCRSRSDDYLCCSSVGRRSGHRQHIDFRCVDDHPLYGLDALPRDSESACQTCAAGIGPQCDLHPDCGELYAVLSDYARRHHGHCALLGGMDHCTFWGMLSALAFKSGGLAQLRALPRARLVHCVCRRTFD